MPLAAQAHMTKAIAAPVAPAVPPLVPPLDEDDDARAGETAGGASVKVLLHELRERGISLATMEPMVRVGTVLAVGLLVAGLVLGLLKAVDLPTTKLAIGGANPIEISVPALAFTLLSFGLAWCYAIAGTLYAPPLLRLVVFAAFAVAMFDQGSAAWTSPTSARGVVLMVGLAVLLGAIAAHGLTRDSGGRLLVSRSERALLGTVFGLVAAVQVIAWWGSRGAPVRGVFVVDLILELSAFAILANLFLASAGGDFAQVADLVASTAGSVVRASASRKLFPVAALALGVGLLARAIIRTSWSLPAEAGLALLGALVIAAVARRNARVLASARRLPSWAVVLVGLGFQAALTAAVLVATLGSSSPNKVTWRLPPPVNLYRHTAPPQFSIAVPPGWSVLRISRDVLLSGVATGVPALGEVREADLPRPLSRMPTAAQWRHYLEGFDSTRYRSVHFVRTAYPDRLLVTMTTSTGTRLASIIRGAAQGTEEWVIQVFAARQIWPDFENVAAAMVTSWRPDLRAHAVVLRGSEQPSGSGASGQFGAIGLGTTALLAFLLLAWRLPRTWVLTGVLLSGCMMLAGLTDLREVVAIAVGHRVSGIPHLSFAGIEAAVAIALIALTLAALHKRRAAWLRRRQMAIGPLAVLAVALLLIELLFNLYAGAASAGPLLTVGGVTFLIGAFLWDVALSGDLTNRDGHRMRRPARVFMYMGYMLAASAAVLYFGSAHELGPWAVHDYFFAPEQEVALSLAIVATAYAATICLIRLMSAGTKETPTADAATPGEHVAPEDVTDVRIPPSAN